MKHQNRLTGYCFAAFTVVVWGSTFISSKVLLEFYTPAQIMLTRFILAYCALWLLRPKRLTLTLKQEGTFFLLGLLGCTAYFYTENTALSYTLASNVSIIVAAAPIFTAILAHFAGEERFRVSTLAGFLVAFSGVILVVCNGTFVLKLNPRGDLLALAAAVCWAIYSVLLRRGQPGAGFHSRHPPHHVLGHRHRAAAGGRGGRPLSHGAAADGFRCGKLPLFGSGWQCPLLRPVEQGLPPFGRGHHQYLYLSDALYHHRGRPDLPG